MTHPSVARKHFMLGFVLVGTLAAGFGFFLYSFVGNPAQEVVLQPMPVQAERILDFWLGSHEGKVALNDTRIALWEAPNPPQKEIIQQRFKNDLSKVISGDYGFWALHPRGRLAMIILLDRFLRVMDGDAAAWRHNKEAVELALTGIRLNQDSDLTLAERAFFYQPLLESESLEVQNRAYGLYERLSQLAPQAEKKFFEKWLLKSKMHQKLIYEFGRFPERNEGLNREPSVQEKEYLSKKK